jgi:hypothetical protein
MTHSSASQGKSKGINKLFLFFLSSIGTTIFMLSARISYPSIFVNGRIWAEEGAHFLANAHLHGPLASVFYIHKRHLDLIPNLASAIAVSLPSHLWPRVFPAVATIPYVAMFACVSFALLQIYTAPVHNITRIPYSTKNIRSQNPFVITFLVSIYSYLISVAPSGWESMLNTINSWSVVVASFAIIIPFLSGALSFVIPFFLASGVFPVTLFFPYIFLRYLLARSRTAFMILLGIATGTFFQVSLIVFTPQNLSLPLVSERSFSLNDVITIPTLIIERALPPVAGNFNAIASDPYLSAAFWNFAIRLAGSILLVALLIFLLKLLSSAAYNSEVMADVTARHSFLLLPKTCFSSAITLHRISESLLAILTWQSLALMLTLGGPRKILFTGGGDRYFFSFYCVCTYALIALFYVSFLRAYSRFPYKHMPPIDSPPKFSLFIMLLTATFLVLQTFSSALILNNELIKNKFWCFHSPPVNILSPRTANYEVCPPSGAIDLENHRTMIDTLASVDR